jgi:hypothetical protein
MKSRAYAAGAAVIGSAAVAYILVDRPRQLGWGATDEETDAILAGEGPASERTARWPPQLTPAALFTPWPGRHSPQCRALACAPQPSSARRW